MANVKHGPAHLRRRNPDGTKTCAGPCGMDLPANSVYFDRDETKEDGLRTVCKVCRSKERELAKQDKSETMRTRPGRFDYQMHDYIVAVLDVLRRAAGGE